MGRPRMAVYAAFFCFGTIAGSLVPRMPAFKESLGLTDGQVGLAFLAYAVSAVAGAALARPVMAWGARRLVQGGTLVILALLIGPAVAPGFGLFAVSFLLLGIVGGFIDVLENSQAAEIEREAGRPMINGFHGFWSLGFIAGAVGSAVAASLGIGPLPHFMFVAVVVGAVSVPLLSGLPDTRGGATTMLPRGTTSWRIAPAAVGRTPQALAGLTADR